MKDFFEGLATFIRHLVRGRKGSIGSIRELIDLHEALPEGATSRLKLRSHIDRRIEQLIRSETELTRDGSGIVASLFLLGLGGYGSWFGFVRGGWWWFVFALGLFLVLLGAVGFEDSARKKRRDEQGKSVDHS